MHNCKSIRKYLFTHKKTLTSFALQNILHSFIKYKDEIRIRSFKNEIIFFFDSSEMENIFHSLF